MAGDGPCAFGWPGKNDVVVVVVMKVNRESTGRLDSQQVELADQTSGPGPGARGPRTVTATGRLRRISVTVPGPMGGARAQSPTCRGTGTSTPKARVCALGPGPRHEGPGALAAQPLTTDCIIRTRSEPLTARWLERWLEQQRAASMYWNNRKEKMGAGAPTQGKFHPTIKATVVHISSRFRSRLAT